jgi:hypothetical protein
MEVRQLECEHRFRYFARFGSLVVAFLLCLGVFFLPLSATGSEMPSALAMANMPRLDLEPNGNPHSLDGTYLVVPGEETEDAEKHPLKAELLTMLLLTLGAEGLHFRLWSSRQQATPRYTPFGMRQTL